MSLSGKGMKLDLRTGTEAAKTRCPARAGENVRYFTSVAAVAEARLPSRAVRCPPVILREPLRLVVGQIGFGGRPILAAAAF
jgi:hypothetical protein